MYVCLSISVCLSVCLSVCPYIASTVYMFVCIYFKRALVTVIYLTKNTGHVRQCNGHGLSTVLTRFFAVCNAIHLCKTDPNNNRLEYKKFTQGIGSAVFIASLQGNTSTLIYSTNKTLIPLPLVDLQFDISCWK
jgi:hypothetical protein